MSGSINQRRNEMRKLLVAAVTLALASPVMALTCPAGQHVQCPSGSGRGGGVHGPCVCVQNPIPNCYTAWGTAIQYGSCKTLYTTYSSCLPCDQIGTQVCCNGGVLTPNITGYPVCNQVSCGGDDNGD
jgi:hypothetical protein